MSNRAEFAKASAKLQAEISKLVRSGARLEVIKAPPGSGKTRLLAAVSNDAFQFGLRVAVATQTNAQADDVVTRLLQDYPKLPVVRFLKDGASAAIPPTASTESKWANLPTGPCIVVGTSAKWGLAGAGNPFDICLVEEAWQLSWSDFMLLHRVAGRYFMIGDPGQISPVVTIDTARWETALLAPHRSAPEVVMAKFASELAPHTLPATWRLPADSAKLVKGFYDFEFGGANAPEDRKFVPDARVANKSVGKLLERMSSGSIAGYVLPTAAEGPPLERDREIASHTAELITHLLNTKGHCHIDGQNFPLEAKDFGVIATHRAMVSEVQMSLPAKLRNIIKVDTPERWQGLEQKIILFVHPLSGTVRPSSFDLETGRLCVMASRHKVSCIVVSRDHLGDTLDSLFMPADQAVGRPDRVGRGHSRHSSFWRTLMQQNLIVRAG